MFHSYFNWDLPSATIHPKMDFKGTKFSRWRVHDAKLKAFISTLWQEVYGTLFAIQGTNQSSIHSNKIHCQMQRLICANEECISQVCLQ